jgi:glutamyl-tRNA reductase
MGVIPSSGRAEALVEADRLAVVGTSFRRVGFERLARFVLPEDDGGAEVARLRDALGAREAVYVATCNRVECYLALPPGQGADAARLLARAADFFALRAGGAAEEGSLFARTGRDALAHLCGVAASLDSLVIGESEIAGQLRRAAERALEAGLAGASLRRAFDRASRVARRVRTETAIGRTPVSVASLCVRHVREHLGAGAPGARAALVGAGEVVRKVAGGLAELGVRLLFVNRTREKAEALAARFGGEAASLAEFRAAPPAALDALVTATASPLPVVGLADLAAALERPREKPLIVCDLGLPPDVDAALARDPRVRLVALADLEAIARENRARLEGEVAGAEAIVREEVDAAVRALQMRAVAEESVEALLAERLGHLGADDRETLRRFTATLAERLARQP